MSKVRILLVDDFAFWRELVSSLLEKEPSFEIVCEVVDGQQAVLMAERLQPTIVLLDIGLPKLNGIDVAGWIRTLAPSTKILFLSDTSDKQIVQEALNLACGYVLKSDAATDLVAAVRSVASGKPFISSQLAGLGLEAKCW